jgi:hypothetical protein
MDAAMSCSRDAGWNVDRLVLRCARRVLVAGGNRAEVAAALQDRGLEADTLATDAGGKLPAYAAGCFGAVILGDVRNPLDNPVPVVCEAVRWLAPFGALYLSFRQPSEAGPVLAAVGFRPYWAWTVAPAGEFVPQASPEACSLNAGTHAEEAPPPESEETAPGPMQRAACVVMAVRHDYSPVDHARALYEARRPDWALEVLANVPAHFLQDTEARALVAAERLRCILTWDRTCGPEGRLARFSRALREFYIATTLLPRRRPPYLVQAAFWQVVGDADMGVRWVRSVDYAIAAAQGKAPGPPVWRKRIAEASEETAPEWKPPSNLPRLLFVAHEESDYGLDTLYDGLCRTLGPQNVVEFPWKPTLHGRLPDKTYGYPCFFNHPGAPASLKEICTQLRSGEFDYVCVVDTLRTLPRNLIEPVMEATGTTPVFVIDTWDECGDYQQDALEHLMRDSVCAYFKREMLARAEYGPNTYPLPFAYPDGLVPASIAGDRPEPVFWAGKRMCGLRSLYLDHLESALGMRFDKNYEQDEYIRSLHRARIGLSFFGLGFDTVRYWELPAHGCLLLSERPPIRIPDDFRDGQSAVFFDDLAELEDKLRYYLAHPEDTRAIALAGHEHFKRYHTGAARARQFLGRIQQVMEANR